MKKSLLALLLAVPLVAGALYLRSVASWRPQKVFVAKNWESHQLLFPRDGKTLIGLQRNGAQSFHVMSSDRVVALDVKNNFASRWSSNARLFYFSKAQFFANNSHILVDGLSTLTFDVRTGKTGSLPISPRYGKSVLSPDGKWLARLNYSSTGRISIHPAPLPVSGARIPSTLKILGVKGQTAEAFAFSPNSKTLVVGVGDSKGTHLELYDTTTWKRRGTWKDSTRKPVGGPYFYYEALLWSPNGQFLCSRWGHPLTNEVTTSTWNTTTGERLSDQYLLETRDNSSPTEIDNQGRTLLVSSFEITRNFITGNTETLLRSPKGDIRAAAISPDDSYLVVATMSGELWKQRLK